MPAGKIAGPDRPILVHRLWTKDDIDKAASHLQDPKTSGNRFVPVFQAFRQEFKSTVPEIKMSATDYQKISSKLAGDQRCVHPVYNHQDNATYRRALQDLMDEIKKQFPDKIDIGKITVCRQKPNEPVEDYLTRLTATFDQTLAAHEGCGKCTSATVS